LAAFFKTFLFCLAICIGFVVYKFIGSESYNSKLDFSTQNPVFSPDKKQKDEASVPEEKNEQTEQPKIETYTYTCYFYKKDGTLSAKKREVEAPKSVENAIALLLKGPTVSEIKEGIYTEIPKGTSLISVKNNQNSVIVNLNSTFGSGGGTQSVENRVKQLSKTVKSYYPNKKIYLYIDNKEVEYLGGDGVYIKQPLD